MTKEEAINKAIEIEFGLGNARSIREHNSSLVKIAEHLYDLLHPSLPSNLDEAAEKHSVTDYDSDWPYQGIKYESFKAGAGWLAGQGVSYQATISADKTIPVLPMKDVSDMGLDYGDRVIVQIRKKE